MIRLLRGVHVSVNREMFGTMPLTRGVFPAFLQALHRRSAKQKTERTNKGISNNSMSCRSAEDL